MLIDKQRIEFPPARLAMRTRDGEALVLLHSDDPPDAIDDDYMGNSYYIEMTLDVPESVELSAARWAFKAPTSERIDTDNGIYLDGRKRHLQPFDVTVEFDGQASPVKVWLSGQFLEFDASEGRTVPGRIVAVTAELDAELLVKQGRR
jgi:hypothetical protein